MVGLWMKEEEMRGNEDEIVKKIKVSFIGVWIGNERWDFLLDIGLVEGWW